MIVFSGIGSKSRGTTHPTKPSDGFQYRARTVLRSVLRVVIVALTMLQGIAYCNEAVAEDYRLGPDDKIRLKAYEWRASRDEIIEWKAVNDEFTVAANGTLSVPFAGEIPANGLSPAELAKVISERLQLGLGLGRAPDTSVEVTKFRPFYIVGHVDRPGEYPYRPALTVLKALGIAGGLQRLTDQSSARLGREAIASTGELSLLSTQASSLLARKARVQAELKNAAAITFSMELMRDKDEPLIALTMQQEQLIFDARREALDTQLRALNQLKDHLYKEIDSLDGQLETEDKQIKLVKKELQSIITLVEKGLSVAPRQLSLERTLAQIEGDRLRVGTALLKAKQEISKTDIAIIELKNKWANDATTVLRETQSRLDELARRFYTTEQLLYESEVIAPQSMSQRSGKRKIEPVYKIVRHKNGQATEFSATEAANVEPGDTIKVEVPALIERSPSTDSPPPLGSQDMAPVRRSAAPL